jgi:bacterioferritin (cytochrome b1)
MAEERLDETKAIERLNAALSQQYRSTLQYSIAASSLTGIEAQALAVKLTGFGDEELSGARSLVEKIVSFGGEPTTEIAPLRYEAQASAALEWLCECEQEVIEARQESIEPTGREGRSEALEHMLEHQIGR